MTSLRKAVLLVLLFLPAVAHADISFVPAQPAAGQPFQLQIRSGWGDSCFPVPKRVDVNNRQLTVTFEYQGNGVCLPAGSPWNVDVSIPGLDAGKYTLTARLMDWDGPRVLFTRTVDVSGTPSGLTITPNFDKSAGNRVVHISGKFACAVSPCATPTVLFGSKPAEAVEVKSSTEIDAVVPSQTNIRFVDVTVRGDGYNYVAPSAFTYVGEGEYKSVLVPVVLRKPVAGAYGSLWSSEFRIVNQTSLTLVDGTDLFPFSSECQTTCGGTTFPPKTVITPGFVWPNPASDVPPAVLFYVRSELAPFLTYELRVRDLSRQSETWGTEIPVLSSFSTKITLLDIPMTAGFRQLLRLYSPSYVGCCMTNVKFYANSGELLATRSVALQHPDASIGGLVPPPYVRAGSRQFALQPAYAEIDLGTVAEIRDQQTIWMTADSNYGFALWGFVSVTNDATQHVTTITPR